MENWNNYNATATKYMESLKDYQELNGFFRNGDWTTHEHV